MKSKLLLPIILSSLAFAAYGQAAVIAGWTFQTSVPLTAGPHAAENGINAATSFASTNSGGTISSPLGNGSSNSFNSNGWADGEYYQFTTSTLGYSGVTVSYAQAASGTGPKNFKLQYSIDGITFTDFASYVGPTADFSNGTTLPILSYDLTAITGLDEATSIGFRIVVVGTENENGTTLSNTGTFRVDDFVVNVVPEPTTALLGCLGVLSLCRRRRF